MRAIRAQLGAWAIFAAGCVASFAAAARGESAPAPGPVVVELFTSQACPYCPEADAFLATLAKRDDIIALSLPIDYWDYGGWRDTLARPEHTARQRAYARSLPNRRVYTPQVVVDGAQDVNGMKTEAVLQAIDAAHDHAHPVIGVSRQGSDLSVALPAQSLERPATVWLAPYAPGPLAVDVAGGQNKGKRLTYCNVVRGLRAIAEWDGAARDLSVAIADAASAPVGPVGYAVIAQDGAGGHIVAAGRLAP